MKGSPQQQAFEAYRDQVRERTEERLEDVRWLARCGEPMHEVARRVHMKPESLQRWLQRNDPELQKRLTDNSHQRGLNLRGELVESLHEW